jgi:hypothetical protein
VRRKTVRLFVVTEPMQTELDQPVALASSAPSPLVIGGTGGSGTGLVTRIVCRTGRFMGSSLNPFDDALDLARFDWRWGLSYLRARAIGEEQEIAARMASHHDEALRRHLAPLGEVPLVPWGWKHPHSYLMLPFLSERHRNLRFVHVVRDGRDVAFSSNQRQALHYGPVALGERWTSAAAGAVRSAAYWAWANELAVEDGQRHLGERYLCVRFEDLCIEPEAAAARLLDFACGGAADDELIAQAVAEISPPASVGRWRRAGDDLATAVTDAARPVLRRLGYLEE